MPVLRGGLRLERHREALRRPGNRRSRSSTSRMPAAWYLPTSAACRKRVDIRGITPQRPLGDAGENRPPSTYTANHAGRARQDPAENAGRALHRRRPAGRLAHAVAGQRPRAVAGDDPQRDGRPGGAGPHRQPAHQRRPHADRARLPAVRRHHADGAADLAHVGARSRRSRRSCSRPAAARDRQRRAAAVEPVELRRRGHRAAQGRACSTTSSSCACRSGACW